ncbi:MAG: hisA [Ignavibacteria bacterium]|nr:hisA [Ignavibacteria bacterium]
MLLVIPEIELIDGHCSTCISGENGTEELYQGFADNPMELCKLWRRENAKTIQITNSDSFNSCNFDINSGVILYIAGIMDNPELNIPIQLYSNFHSYEECRNYLNNGIHRIIIEDLLTIDPDAAKELIKEFSPSRVSFFIKFQKDKIVNKDIISNISIRDYAGFVKNNGGNRLIICDQDSIEKNTIPDLEMLARIASDFSVRLTLYRSAKTPQQLWEVNKYFTSGIDSVIIGKALYQNNFPCQKIWRLIEAEIEPHIQ